MIKTANVCARDERFDGITVQGDCADYEEARATIPTSPLRLLRASSASLASVKVMNANPLDLPVSLSIITFASVSVPNRPKASLKSSLLV